MNSQVPVPMAHLPQNPANPNFYMYSFSMHLVEQWYPFIHRHDRGGFSEWLKVTRNTHQQNSHLTGFPQVRENPVTRKTSSLRLSIVIFFPPDLLFYLYCQAKYSFHLILWCVGTLNSFFTAGCHLSGVPVWAAQPYQGTLKVGWHQTQICPALISQAQMAH